MNNFIETQSSSNKSSSSNQSSSNQDCNLINQHENKYGTGWKWGQPTDYIRSRDNFYEMSPEIEKHIRRLKFTWGFGDFSQFIFYSKYSRRKSDDSYESWHDVAIRCTNGSMTLLKNHMRQLKFKLGSIISNPDDHIYRKEFCKIMSNYKSWDDVAKCMAENILNMRMLPPGRGLWGMGELAFKRGGMVLNNCGAATTKDLRKGATWTMGALMYGCGVGFDTEFRGPVIKPNKKETFTYVIPDTREGWAESLGYIIDAYVPRDNLNNKCGKFPIFDYSKIRMKGERIRTFGGTASGPEPLRKLHKRIEIYFDTFLDMQDATTNNQKLDIFNKLVDSLIPTDFNEHSISISKLYDLAVKSNNNDVSSVLNQMLKICNESLDLRDVGKTLIKIIKNTIPNIKNYTRDKINTIIEICKKSGEKDTYNELIGAAEKVVSHIADEQDLSEIMKPIVDEIDKIHLQIVEINVKRIKDTIRENIKTKTYDYVRLIVDIMNSIGACVVAGNVRRSSMLAIGDPSCSTFRLLKDYKINPEREKISYMSNNSVKFSKTEQYTEYLPKCAKQTAVNGEPGYFFLLNVKRYGRIGHLHKPTDPKTREQEEDKATIPNPCSEIPLEPFELCNVVELPLNRFLRKMKLSDSSILDDMFDLEGFLICCILALIYGKSVSVFPTGEHTTNAIIRRNHRIGISITGGAQVHDCIGMTHYIKILKAGYNMIRQADCWLSSILGVRESIRVTTCKPSGTVSLLSGSTPGIHFCHHQYIKRRVRLSTTSKLIDFLVENGYEYEKDLYSDNTLVFEFGLNYGSVRSVQNVSMYEQLVLLQMYQGQWADNMVSVTVTFNPKTESDQLQYAIPQFAPTIKSVSFLPNIDGIYNQMPLEKVDKSTYLSLNKKINWSLLDGIDENSMPRGCTNEHCTL